jgi:hypothetical protein
MQIIFIVIDGINFPQVRNLIPFFLTLLILILMLIIIKNNFRILGKSIEINEAEIGIGNQKIKIKPNYEDIQIAYKLWVELSTRKIGIEIDFENDVIIEIYNSWYDFFKLTRELIKDIPINKVRKDESTRKIVNIAIDVLNDGLRPHLTLWQAKYRRWYQVESAKTENELKSPQEIQKGFPEYHEMIRDMKDINGKLIKYRELLKQIALDIN